MRIKIKEIIKVCILLLLSLKLYASASGLRIRASTDESEVYVHAQLILTLEIQTELNLQNGALAKPEIPDAVVETLVEDNQREIIKDGIPSIILSRSYAVFPSKPGTLTIPSVIFEATAIDPSSHGLGGFFGRGRRLRASTRPISIQVKDVPEAFPKNQPFLPAKSLTIVESFDDEKAELNVNQALTRRFEIKALGSLPSFLPILKAPTLTGCQVYSEAGTKAQEKRPEGLIASVNFSQVYLPSEPGDVSIPEQVVYWWDTEHDQLKTTPIRSFEFKVAKDASKALQAVVPTVPKNPHPETHIAQEAPKVGSSLLWPLLAALFFLLWIATLLYIILRRRSPKFVTKSANSEIHENLFRLIANVQKACDKAYVPEILSSLRELLKWSFEHEEDKVVLSKLRSPIHVLESASYGGKNIAVSDAILEIKKYIIEIKNLGPKKESLPRLYPL